MTDRPQRIVQVLAHASGGIGVHVRDLTAGLKAAGDHVLVVAPQATIHRFNFGPAYSEAWPLPSRPQRIPGALRRLRTIARGADVVHAQGHQAGTVALLATRGLNVPVVVSWHNQVLGSRRGLGDLGVAAERFQAHRADLVTGASQDLVARARELGARRAEEAPVAAPAAGTYPGTRERARSAVAGVLDIDPKESKTWVLTVSRLAPQKDLGVLAEAARQLRDEQVRWIVVGDGDADIRRELIAATGGLPFHLVGARDDVPAFMAAADLLVVPSRWEARALVVQEALAASLPVVATDVGGLPELIAGVGELVPVGDARSLAREVCDLVRSPARRRELGVLARERFTTLPTSADVTRAWRERYRSVARA